MGFLDELFGGGGIGDDSAGWSEYAPQQADYSVGGYGEMMPFDMSSPVVYGSDLVDSAMPQGESYGYDAYQIPQAQYVMQEQASQGQPSYLSSVWDSLNSVGKGLESPAGKLTAGLFGAGVSAYGANKANKNVKKAYKDQQAMLAARQAKAAQYDSPLRLASARQAVTAPQARGGETAFFTNNRIPSYFAEGGGVSEEELESMQQEAQQGALDARMDRPSAIGFLRYMMAGKRMPSEIAAAKRAQRPNNPVDIVRARNRALEEAGNYASGGTPRFVQGGTPGQADKIPAMLSDGEYVVDSDVVSALGDGNNAAGAVQLDGMRQQVRKHKRSTPVNKIPPKAKSPLAYMKKGKK